MARPGETRSTDVAFPAGGARRLLASLASWLYLAALYVFIFLPVAVLVLFSFQDGRLPVPPFNGFSLQWYEAVFADGKLMAALGNSLLVAILSSLVALASFSSGGILLASGWTLVNLLVYPVVVISIALIAGQALLDRRVPPGVAPT